MNRPPSVDALLRLPDLAPAIERFGRGVVLAAVRDVLGRHRAAGGPFPPAGELAAEAAAQAARQMAPGLRRVFNLTGTVLHTNLGRAQLSRAAIDHAVMAMAEPCTLEFDLGAGARGSRDNIVAGLLAELSGAEAATAVNNNAAAVVLVLAAIAGGREVVVSRGELVEIGGSFRIPDVMRAAGVRLVEVGTTNRTHPRDYRDAIGPNTAALMKVHASNYRISGFTHAVAEAEVAQIAHEAGLPLVVDLGAGSLVDLVPYGLPREPVVRDMVAAGADVVTFSGDKLLGGPQAGLVVGRQDLVAQVRRHPLMRALRLSKITLAALEATLAAYRSPDRLAQDLPTLRFLTRPVQEIAAQARRLAPRIAELLGDGWRVEPVEAMSQVGSGSLPGEVLPSHAIAIASAGGSGAAVERLAASMRALPCPVIGRIAENRLLLDLRCLADEDALLAQLAQLEGTRE